jgi:hypothetical protein
MNYSSRSGGEPIIALSVFKDKFYPGVHWKRHTVLSEEEHKMMSLDSKSNSSMI